ncbi:hypothetical protein [Bradyrhizobium sp. CCBAU 45384]|uniref:hypothetical protein n=1 Tax=Bradyrhizobium sp. CCBAU 45384 TaxID=858428 RepID=UPI0023055B31|nr:hypothetical protein [Bradyrhizobium sp. CCBAU 45384]
MEWKAIERQIDELSILHTLPMELHWHEATHFTGLSHAIQELPCCPDGPQMFRSSPLAITLLLPALVVPASYVVADDQPIPPAEPKSQQECTTYQRQQIDYAHAAAQKSRECSEKYRTAKSDDIVLYQSSCGGNILSAFKSCRALSDEAWCALAGVSDKVSACLAKAGAAEQKRLTEVLAQSEKQKKVETEKVPRRNDAARDSGSGTSDSAPQEQEHVGTLERHLTTGSGNAERQTASSAKGIDDASGAKQVMDDTTAELRKVVQHEQERASRLEAALAAARREVEAQTALATKAIDEANRMKQTAEQSSAELKLTLEKEHERAEAFVNDLSMAHATIYAYEAQARRAADRAAAPQEASETGAAELRRSLQQEQERGERLAHDLEAARQEIELQAAQASAEATRLKQVAADTSAVSLRLLQREREKTAQLERELASQRNAASGDTTKRRGVQDKRPEADAIRPVATSQTTLGATRTNARPDSGNAAEVARLVARASVLLGQGDIASARAVLERAAEIGDARASFALAETYDPIILRKWGAYGTVGDTAKARDLYARARAGGIKEAEERLDSSRR